MRILILILILIGAIGAAWLTYIALNGPSKEDHRIGVAMAKALDSRLRSDPARFGSFEEVRYEAAKNDIHLKIYGWNDQQSTGIVIEESRAALKSLTQDEPRPSLTLVFLSKEGKTISTAKIKED